MGGVVAADLCSRGPREADNGARRRRVSLEQRSPSREGDGHHLPHWAAWPPAVSATRDPVSALNGRGNLVTIAAVLLFYRRASEHPACMHPLARPSISRTTGPLEHTGGWVGIAAPRGHCRRGPMNNDHLPYSKEEISDPAVAADFAFLKSLEDAARRSRVFDHPLLTSLAQGKYSTRSTAAVFGHFAHHIRIFTSCLGHLIGTAPDLQVPGRPARQPDRGTRPRGHHPRALLALPADAALDGNGSAERRAHPHAALHQLNEQLLAATRASFVQGLAWLGIGGELTIPNNFPYLVTAGRRALRTPTWSSSPGMAESIRATATTRTPCSPCTCAATTAPPSPTRSPPRWHARSGLGRSRTDVRALMCPRRDSNPSGRGLRASGGRPRVLPAVRQLLAHVVKEQVRMGRIGGMGAVL